VEKQFYVYIMTNARHNALYNGVTSDLQVRVYKHKSKQNKGFTSRYNINMLVYYEDWVDAYHAIAREKQIKGGSRQDRIDLINKMNPGWCDLYEQL
jgi:putative endonuclease